jgi:hypothetical protein
MPTGIFCLIGFECNEAALPRVVSCTFLGMSDATPGPRCPSCRRSIAAWRLDHCVYCGERFPPDLKESHAEPEALKWVERPPIPHDAAKQFEMMKVFPTDPKSTIRSRPVLLGAGVISMVAFAVVFILLYLLLNRTMPAAGGAVLFLGAGFVGYLLWVFYRASRRGPR